MFASLETPIAVVAHDAGAANHLFAWLAASKPVDLIPCLSGPALSLWQQTQAVLPPAQPATALATARTLLSGSGWASDVEHDARRIARQQGIRSIAVLDHWTHYRERFIRAGHEVLPDEIWVSDAHALRMAEAEFPGIRIVQQENAYLARQLQEVRRFEQGGAPRTREQVLYVLEPIRQAWGNLPREGEFLALDFLVENLRHLQLGDNVMIRLRPHPSDQAGKYDDWIARQNNPMLTLDTTPTLAQALAWSTTVIGCQSYAMVVALAAGRKVISSIPPWAKACVLPHPEIIRLPDLLPQAFSQQNAEHDLSTRSQA